MLPQENVLQTVSSRLYDSLYFKILGPLILFPSAIL